MASEQEQALEQPSGQPGSGEVYMYEAPWQIYGLTWSVQKEHNFRLAIGSFIQGLQNKVQIVKLDQESGKFMSNPKLSFDHPYPTTKIMFIPDKECQKPDLLATSADHLRILQIHEDRVELQSLLTKKKKNSGLRCNPVTSFDWNEMDMKRLGTCSIDRTCTIWDVEREVVERHLTNAHDKAVYDIAWGGRDVFGSVSDDGSLRVFDLRRKNNSTIMFKYENPENTALLRLGWNKQAPPYMAATVMDSAKVIVLDIRSPTRPVVELQKHHAFVNAVAWDLHDSCQVCTVGEDSQALIWDLSAMTTPTEVNGSLEPSMAYTAEAGINQVQWSSTQPDLMAIAYAKKLQILRVKR